VRELMDLFTRPLFATSSVIGFAKKKYASFCIHPCALKDTLAPLSSGYFSLMKSKKFFSYFRYVKLSLIFVAGTVFAQSAKQRIEKDLPR
jgi:ABC-type amino acid transport system permease subunit